MLVLYGAFAVAATLVNLVVQRLVLMTGTPESRIFPAIAAGTVAGLLAKYLFDKKWIFLSREVGVKAHSRQFTMYAITGVLTTLVFWGVEFAFWLFWRDDYMREIGAIIGLSVGYVVKYRLDSRFVFSGLRSIDGSRT